MCDTDAATAHKSLCTVCNWSDDVTATVDSCKCGAISTLVIELTDDPFAG